MKKKVSSLSKKIKVYLIFLVIFSIFILYVLIYLFPDIEITGLPTAIATIGFVIEGEVTKTINISSPLNTTYNFGIGDPYTIDLNVSADFAVDNWWYTLWDLRHNQIVNDSIAFTPNITFNAVRWENKMAVYANDSADTINANVTFFVNVPNSAPVLGDINSSIYVCEGNSLNYNFNATDVDEDSITIDISPKNPFFVNPTSFNGQINMNSNIISGVLDKDDAGGINNGFKTYEETVSISDGEFVDTADTDITVIEINNEPVMANIGVQTVWTVGEDSTFYHEVQVTDVEDGNQDSGNLNFNVSFAGERLFNISSNGVMNFTPEPGLNSRHIGNHDITVCVNDTGISSPHSNISICGQDGSSATTCQDFRLTVTNANRPPTIIDFYPENLVLNVSGTDSLFFNISEFDPDGTIPDAYWFVGGIFKEYDSGSLVDEFTYSFGCGISGTSTINATITDGLRNDSVEWAINIALVECPEGVSPGAGGGGVISCEEKWGCGEWRICQNAEKSLEVGILSGGAYRIIQEECKDVGLDVQSCGIQIRMCFDVNLCSTNYYKPSEFQSCHYTDEPSCSDGIKNCHQDSCELLVDCGGPCNACATCSDKIRNQGEEGVDCGGPCPWKCPIEKPLLKKAWVLNILIIIIFLLLLIVIIKIARVFKIKKLLRYIPIKRRSDDDKT